MYGNLPRYTVHYNERTNRYEIRVDGKIATDPQEGLPLDRIPTKARAEAMANRLKAF